MSIGFCRWWSNSPSAASPPVSSAEKPEIAINSFGVPWVVLARSRSVTEFLRGRGIDAVNVAGGTGEWESRGWAVER